jgi:hypothetical protein
MRKVILAAASAIALVGGATTANAASVVTSTSPSSLTPPASAIFGTAYNNLTTPTTTFNDQYTFNVVGGALADAQVSTILLGNTANVTFSSVYLDTVANSFTKTSTDPAPETWALLNPVSIGNGLHTIFVNGTVTGASGAYGGTLNVQAPVPEPATWLMMLLGFGAMGMVVRRRRVPALAQVA